MNFRLVPYHLSVRLPISREFEILDVSYEVLQSRNHFVNRRERAQHDFIPPLLSLSPAGIFIFQKQANIKNIKQVFYIKVWISECYKYTDIKLRLLKNGVIKNKTEWLE